MGITRYSEPSFDPYGDAVGLSVEPATDWSAPTAAGPLDAVLQLPGSKSLTNRELVLAALADGPGRLIAPLASRDTRLMTEALRTLGVSIEEILDEQGEDAAGTDPDLVVTPADELVGGGQIDTGLAGTVMRFIPPVAALALGPITIDGDEGARRRPMRATIDALRALGVDVDDAGAGTMPFSLWGAGRIGGGELEIDASASSQFVSGLLLAAPRFEAGLVLRHTGETLPSLPHIEMTVAALAARGVTVTSPEPGVWIVEPGPIAARDVVIEPDLSNAAPFLVAALVAGGRVGIRHWPEATTQVGADLANLLPRFGAQVELDGDVLTVNGGAGIRGGRSIDGVDLDLSHGGELAPALVALAALASSPSRITGIGHLRGHETDRLAALAAEITSRGGRVTELDDGLAIDPAPLSGGLWHSYADHRMATAGAIIGLAVAGIVVEDIATVGKTMPTFTTLWRRMLDGDA